MGCEGGSASACAEGGTLYLKEGGVFRRKGAAATATEESGEAIDDRALAQAANLLDRGCRGGVSVDSAKCCGLLSALMLHPR